jgi:hypothetical protein
MIWAGCGNPPTVIGRALSVRPMQWLGARSNSLYLWHWAILVIAAQYAAHHLSARAVRTLDSHTALRIVGESQPDRRNFYLNFYLNRDYLVVLQKPVVAIRCTDCDAFDARNTQ